MPYCVIHITTLKLKIANKSYDKPRQHIKKQRHYFANKRLYDQSYGFSSNHVWMWELDHKESWAPNNWCFWTVVLEKTLESPLDCKEIKPINLKGNQPWCWGFDTLATWGKESLEKTLMLVKIESKRRKGQLRMRWLDSITDSMGMNLSRERVGEREAWPAIQSMGLQTVWHDSDKTATIFLSNLKTSGLFGS